MNRENLIFRDVLSHAARSNRKDSTEDYKTANQWLSENYPGVSFDVHQIKIINEALASSRVDGRMKNFMRKSKLISGLAIANAIFFFSYIGYAEFFQGGINFHLFFESLIYAIAPLAFFYARMAHEETKYEIANNQSLSVYPIGWRFVCFLICCVASIQVGVYLAPHLMPHTEFNWSQGEQVVLAFVWTLITILFSVSYKPKIVVSEEITAK
ncbi:Uncharacterised protein [Burkholderia pseudomallei]|uniref:hypothetical protein n=1 Tax=Burkholderia pseudomallei TaxID=28450 RepID=UPI0005DCE4F9|nr:hypothetical protein [Burkholderia pseudomallei]CAK1332266.1 Uncharacterised protein [Burkholderia pseudomallei]